MNRTFTGAVSVAVALAVLGSRRRRPSRPDLTRWSWGLVAGVVAQILLGGLVVALEVAPVSVAGHYLLSAVLVANAVVLHHKASEPDGLRRARGHARSCSGGRARLVGLAGARPDHRHPRHRERAPQRRRGGRPAAVRGGDRGARPQPHGVGVPGARPGRAPPGASRGDAAPSTVGRGRLLVAAIVAQGTLGYVQYAADVPEALVGAHVLGSVLVWVAVLRFHLALTEPIPAARGRAGHVAAAPLRRPVMAGPVPAPVEVDEPVDDTVTEPDAPWIVLVWNDPINLMSYVAFVLQKLFGYPKEKADRLMMQVHTEGRAVVANGPRETCELHVFRLHEHGLWATMQHDT